jgi:hypothetical protein
MVELITKVRRYGSDRRHIEIPKNYFDELKLDEKVVVLDKETYTELKKKKKA